MPFLDKSTVGRRVRILSTGLGVLFIVEGLTKWAALPLQVELFRRLGMPPVALQVVGSYEILMAGLLLNPPTRPYGAMGLAALMAGASLVHVMTGAVMQLLFATAFLLTACVWVVIKDRPAFLRIA